MPQNAGYTSPPFSGTVGMAQPRTGFEQYPQPIGMQGFPVQPTQQNPSLIKVLSEAEAQSYPVAFGASVAMLDTQQPKLYIKSVDGNGVPSMLKYRLIEDRDEPSAPVQDMRDTYVTREEYTKLCQEHERMMMAITQIAERVGTADEHEQSGG